MFLSSFVVEKRKAFIEKSSKWRPEKAKRFRGASPIQFFHLNGLDALKIFFILGSYFNAPQLEFNHKSEIAAEHEVL